ncbi:hypothetical protein LCGC14_1130870 [marine sediment metagenome]|uniref:Uncharacterized protein n=1 Tax=marine sediment metagenome TaxID=412755 RepID=A0A0F9PJB3_9ZZZZ
MSSAMKDFADKFTRFVKDVDVSFDDHDARIKALEKKDWAELFHAIVEDVVGAPNITAEDVEYAKHLEGKRLPKPTSTTLSRRRGEV